MNEYKNFDDQELTRLLVAGDNLAYAAIFERYSPLLMAHAYRIIEDEDEVGDIVQDVMLSLWEKKSQIKLNLPISGLLYTAVRNRIFNSFSHKKVRSKYADSMIAYMEGVQLQSEDQLHHKELRMFLEKEIKALPDKMREVFVLYKIDELSYKDIALRLGITDKTAKQQVYNAVKILKTKMDAYLSVYILL